MSACPACDSPRHSPSYLGRARFRDFEFEYRSCRDCGSIFVDPMPPPAVLDEIYSPAYLQEHYSAELDGESKSEELRRELRATAELAARLKPGGRLLDVGCGAGQFLLAAREAGLRPEGHERVASTAAMTSASIGLPVHSGSIETIAGGFDVIHFSDVLEHSPRPLELLLGARKLLSPNGLLIARGPLQNQRTLFNLALRFSCTLKQRLGRAGVFETTPTHVVLFSLAGWHHLLRRGGLSLVDESISENHWPAPERPELSTKSVIKEASIFVSRSPLGRRMRSGDRVVSITEMHGC